MKYLQDYTEKATSKLFKDNGAFFAFSDKQFEEAKDKKIPNKDYCNMFAGMVAPKKNSDNIIAGLKKITKEGIKQDIKENGIIGIIKRELGNHECYYTGDYSTAFESLDGYNITLNQVKEVYNTEKNKDEFNN